MFLNQKLSIGISTNDEILRSSKAKEFACYYPEIEKDGFSFSLGWLYNFKQIYIVHLILNI